MQLLLMLLLACVALSALQYALAALVIILVITILWGAFAHPAETFGGLAFFLFGSVLTAHTTATLSVIAFLGFCLIVRRSESEARPPPQPSRHDDQ